MFKWVVRLMCYAAMAFLMYLGGIYYDNVILYGVGFAAIILELNNIIDK